MHNGGETLGPAGGHENTLIRTRIATNVLTLKGYGAVVQRGMSRLLLHRPFRPGPLSDGEAEALLQRVAQGLAPGLEANVAPITWRRGDRSGVQWSTEMFLGDDTFVHCGLETTTGELELRVDTNFPLRPVSDAPMPGYLKAIAALCLLFGPTIGVLTRSVLLGLLATVTACFSLCGSDRRGYVVLVVALLAAGVAAGALTRSAVWGGVLPIVALLGCTIGALWLGVRADRRQERLREARPLAEDLWRARLDQAVAAADASMG